MSNQTFKKDPANRGKKEKSELFEALKPIWLGRRDSNPRMPVPKTGALPLGDAPLPAGTTDGILAQLAIRHNLLAGNNRLT